jgi:hypothetical protein
MMFSLKLFAGILIIYFIFCVYFMITSFEEGSPFKYTKYKIDYKNTSEEFQTKHHYQLVF